MLIVAFSYCYAECHYAECHYAECHCAECHYAECHCAECRCSECRGAFGTSDTLSNLFEKNYTST